MKHMITELRALTFALLLTALPSPFMAETATYSRATKAGKEMKDKGEDKMNKFITSLMKQMTLTEKLGQLNLGAGGDPMVISSSYGLEESARRGMVSAVGGADYNLQRLAVEESRLHIPILFGLDVIHGYATTFPIPLAQASSWDPHLIERGAQIAAEEATASGICWTWSPMVDIARDPRWGRVAEGAGEDPYLGCLIAKAMVRGYQGDDLGSDTTLMACFKHFALYGAPEGGRDYNTVDMSRLTMFNYYLAPYKAAVDAGCATGMSSFNVVDYIPATGNKWLLTDLLRDKWRFRGFMVSDAGSVGEMENHRMGDGAEVARLGITAGLDMDMGSQRYLKHLTQLLKDGKVSMKDIDTSVRRILEAKYRLGLFDDPYRYLRRQKDPKAQATILSDDHVAFARRFAADCIILLKNDGSLLPLTDGAKIAVIGPIGNDPSQLFGTWSTRPDGRKSLSVAAALREALPHSVIVQKDGCTLSRSYGDYYNDSLSSDDRRLISEAVEAAVKADVVIACVGEPGGWSGEAESRVNITIPPSQKAMLKALRATGRKIVVTVFGGRPLILSDEDRNFPALVEAWSGGTQAAQALADVLSGKVNPSARTTITFPRYQGQIPIYYNHLNTGRPLGHYPMEHFTSKYDDISNADNTPLYPFGYGLSYNSYAYSPLRVSKQNARGEGDSITVSLDVTNNGKYSGKEITQLYIADPAASISRPVKELKAFRKETYQPGEKKTISFVITTKDLKFYNSSLHYDWEAGDFDFMVGPNSRDVQTVRIHWDK